MQPYYSIKKNDLYAACKSFYIFFLYLFYATAAKKHTLNKCSGKLISPPELCQHHADTATFIEKECYDLLISTCNSNSSGGISSGDTLSSKTQPVISPCSKLILQNSY